VQVSSGGFLRRTPILSSREDIMCYTRTISLLLGACLAWAVTACSSKPDEQMAQAQKAQDQAKEQRASDYAASEWKNATQAWDQAKLAYDKGRYGEAGTQFLTAKSRFEKARAVAKSKRDAELREIQGLQKAIDIRYTKLKGAIESSGPRLSTGVRKSLDETCREVDKGVDKAKSEVEQGEYATALKAAQEAMRQVYSGEKELEAAAGGKKRSS
jgi:hypothetical protein